MFLIILKEYHKEDVSISSIEFTGNTFKNCPSGGFLAKISNNYINKISGCKFINNYQCEQYFSTYQSSSPIIVLRKNGGTFNLVYDNCHFENNKNTGNGNGGTMNYKDIQSDAKQKISFMNCVFIGNFASGNGGALFLNVDNEVEISDCTFTDNKAQTGSGAIFVDSARTNVYISKCKFTENDNQGNANTISFSRDVNANITIIKTSFTDCSAIDYVMSIPDPIQTITVENTTIQFTKPNNCGGIKIDSDKSIYIKYVNFIYTTNNPALRIDSSQDTNEIIISFCTFDSCQSENISCFDIDMFSLSFEFRNNIFSNKKCIKSNSLIGHLIYNRADKKDLIEFNNLSFISNSCYSKYGGGTPLKIENYKEIQFTNCKFINNEARQTEESRPYYDNFLYFNGDGGGIQLGYTCQMKDLIISFNQCTFEGNKASRHGGAIAIQPSVKVTITKCQFINNIANYEFTKSSELLGNYFHLKKSGRGGAIYINTNYEYKDEGGCGYQNNTLGKVTISESTFKSNNGKDGYAMYIEGDDSSTVFEITNNKFIDNYNKDNYNGDKYIIYGAVITTEIDTVTNDTILAAGNTFEYDEARIRVKEVSLVDHYGNTPSYQFTLSNEFSNSIAFSGSFKFSNSCIFTFSGAFSKSDEFTRSEYFSDSEDFSSSYKFSKTAYFTPSEKFSDSSDFSYSRKFSDSSDFSSSRKFSDSSDFSSSTKFSDSSDFSSSAKLSDSSDFSASMEFTKSGFIPTKQFSESNLFTLSEKFTVSNYLKTKKFSYSAYFTPSNSFSKSNSFSSNNPNENKKGFKKKNISLIVGIVVGLLVLLILIIIIIILIKRKKKTHTTDQSNSTQEANFDQGETNSNSISGSFENHLAESNFLVKDPFDTYFEEDLI